MFGHGSMCRGGQAMPNTEHTHTLKLPALDLESLNQHKMPHTYGDVWLRFRVFNEQTTKNMFDNPTKPYLTLPRLLKCLVAQPSMGTKSGLMKMGRSA